MEHYARAGRVTVQVPKTRGIEFYPGALEKGVRSERALKAFDTSESPRHKTCRGPFGLINSTPGP